MKWKTALVDADTIPRESAYMEGVVFFNPFRGVYACGTGKKPMAPEDGFVEVQIGNDLNGNVSMKQWWKLSEISVVRQQPLKKKGME